MNDERGPQSWWQTLPGVITATAGLITAMAGLIVVLPKSCGGGAGGRGDETKATPIAAVATVSMPKEEPVTPSAPRETTAVVSSDGRRLAESQVVAYWSAWISHDVDGLVSHSSTPFFLDNKVLLTPMELRDAYQSIFHNQPMANKDAAAIQKIETRTLKDWATRGLDPSKDRLLRSIQLDDDDYMVLITVPANGIAFYTRHTANGPAVAGWWD